MELIQEFKNYLLSQKNAASPATVKNYIADVKKFIVWCEQTTNAGFNPQLLTPTLLNEFKTIKSKELSASSLDRHISSLKKFFTFLKLEGRISQSPFELLAQTTPVKIDQYHLKGFKDFLYVYNASHLTIKNYLIDVKQFFTWLEKVAVTEDSYLLSDKNILHKITDELIQEYSDRLLQEGSFSPSTINRKLSSLRKYLSWAASQGLLTDGITTLPGNVKPEQGVALLGRPQNSSAGNEVTEASFEGEERQDPDFSENNLQQSDEQSSQTFEENTNPAYSSFPPLRLSQKIGRGFSLLLDVALVVPFAQLIAALQHKIWILRGKPLFTISNPKLKVLQTPLALTGTKVKNISKSFYNPLGISISHFPWYKKFAFHLQYTRPKWYKRYHRLPVSRYFNWAILIVFCTMIGFGLYSSFFSNARKNQTLAALPTAPPRVLSFQGRLTDNNDNPITTANTHLRFAIYDDTSATGSGHLLWQEVDTVSPDTDGDFSTLLGDGSSCGDPLISATGPCQIPSTLFSQNASLYLGVTVEWTPELAPRQRLATVAYAANSETLQGLPPITAAGAGTQNVVLALDSSGNLAIGASTTFQSTSGQFSLSGNTVAINTNPGSNGNITLSPDGSGMVDIQKPLQNSTLNNNITSAAGAVEVDDLFAILATSSGQSALTINQNGTGPLISASTSGVAKFTVDNSGDIFAAGNITGGTLFAGNGTTYYINNNTSNLNSLTLTGNLNVSGNVTSSLIPDSTLRDLGSVTNYWGNVYATNIISPGSGVAGYWQRNNGAVSPANITDDVLVGGISTASAKFQVFGTTGNATSTGTLTFTNATQQIQTTSMLPLVLGSFSTGSIQLSPKGTTGLYVDGTGNVGIGTTNPTSPLSVLSASSLSTAAINLTVSGADSGSNNQYIAFNNSRFNLGWNGTNGFGFVQVSPGKDIELQTNCSTINCTNANLFVSRNSFVGINTTLTGNAQLVVNQGNTSGAGDIFTASTSGVTKFTIQNNGTASTSGNLVFAGANPTITTTSMNPLTIGDNNTGPIQLSPKGTTGLYVGGSGNVGIGTTNTSSSALNVNGVVFASNNFSARRDGTNGDAFDINGCEVISRNSTAVQFMNDSCGSFWQTAQFFTNGSERLRINSSGFVGIGTTSLGNAQLVVNQTNTSGLGDIFTASAAGATKFTIANDGTIKNSLIPNINVAYDLGSLTQQWRTLYAQSIFLNGQSLTQLWQENAGVVSPINITDDLTIGGNSTSSAKFQVYGLANGSIPAGTASTSGFLTFTNASAQVNVEKGGTLGLYTSPGGDAGLTGPALFVNNSGRIGVNTTSTLGQLDIRTSLTSIPAATVSGNTTVPLVVIDNSGSGDLINGNTAGTTKFRVDNSGIIYASEFIDQQNTSYILDPAASGTSLTVNGNVGIGTTNPSVFKLQVAGNTGPDSNNAYDLGSSGQEWRNIYGQHIFSNGTELTQYWQRNSGALTPLFTTDDLLLGATSTTSARFAVINIAGGTPTATLSAGTNSGTYLTADGTLATRSKQTLALGSQSSTGNITLGSDATARSITIGNTTGTTGLTERVGTGNYSLDGAATSTYAIGASTVGGTITIGGTSQTGLLTFGQSTAGENINIGSGANSVAQQIQIGNGASSANSEVDILSGAGTSGTSTLALANNPRVGTIDIGNVTSTVIRTFTIAGGDDANNDTINILTGNPSNGTQTINLLTGNATGGTQTLNLATGTSAKTINIGGTGGNTIALGNTQTGGSISLGAAMTTGTISIGGTGLQTGSITIGNGTGNQTLDFGNGSGNKTIDIGGSGTNTLNIGSSQTNGNINIGNSTSTTTIEGTNFTTGGVAYATSNTINFTSSGSSGQCLLSNALSAPTWGLCTFGNGNYWNLQQGALFPINATVDFLVGANAGASSSAKFAALNLASGTPTASVSSGLNGTGMSIDANGNIQTANKMTLTIGGNKTGNIVLSPSGGASGTITFNGYSTGVLHSVSGLITSSLVDLQNDITSTLKVDHGGTGLASLASGSLIYGSGGGTANSLSIGNTNDTLVVLGGVPTWSPYATHSALFVTNNTQLNTISSSTNTILPTTNGTLNLGDGAHFFGTIYANNIIAPVGSGTSGFWQLAADVLAPVNTIYDLAVGGSATGSATPWQVFGTTVGVDTAGTATSSGNLSFRGASTEIDLLNGTGLNIKASVGGNGVNGSNLSSVLNISNLGNVTIAGTLAVNGNTLSTATSSTFSLLNGTLSTLNFAQGTSTLTIGTGGTTSTTINGNITLGDNTTLRTINFGAEVGTDIIPNSNNSHDLGSSSNFWRNIYTNNTFANVVSGTQGYWQLNSSVISPAYNWQDLGIGGTGTSSAKFQVFGATGNATTSGNLVFNGLTSTPQIQSTSFQSLLIGGSTTGGILLQPTNGTGEAGVGTSLIVDDGNGAGGSSGIPVFSVSNTNTATFPKLILNGPGGGNKGEALEFYSGGFTRGDLSFLNSNNEMDLINRVGGGLISFKTTLSNSSGQAEALRIDNLGKLAIANSLEGNAQLVVNQTNNSGLGDIFSASTSGTPKFTIANDGTIKNNLIPNQNDFYSLGSDPTAGGKEWDTLYVRQVVTPSGALGTNYWQVSNQGVLSPANLTWDLGIGGNSTAAATFHVVGSGQNSGQMTITANGITTANVASIAATALTSGNLLSLYTSNPQINANNGALLASANLINVGSQDHTYMTLTNSDLTIGGHKNLTTISNVSKVFIYDTSSDSDGGRWTNDGRAQATSWYNEARTAADACVLGTNSRCGQQAFPRKAIIVATTNTNSQGPGLYIFDAKDNSLWMSFTKGSGTTDNMIGPTTNSGGKSVFALNGKIYFATTGTGYGGLYVIDFTKDSAVRYDNTNGYQVGNQTIANRNSAITWRTDVNINTVLTGNSVRDVYANVVNGKTYFAVATVNGPKGCFTLVNDSDESLIARFGVSSGCDGLQTWLTSTGTLYGTYGNAASATNYALKIKYNAQNASGDNQLFDEVYANISSSNYGATKFDTNTFANLTLSPGPASTSATFVPSSMYVTEGTSTVDGVSDTVYLGAQGSNGALMALQTKKGDPSNGSIKYYNQNFITEDLVGDIRGYWPLSESSGNIVDASVKGITLTASSSGITYNVSGVRGTAVTLNGTSGYFYCSDTNPSCGGTSMLDSGGRAWSVGAWVKTTSSNTQGVVTKFNNFVTGSYMLRTSSGHVLFTAASGETLQGVRTVNDGNWHFIVGTFDGSTIRDYVDGQLDGTMSYSGTTPDTTADFAIGAYFTNGFASNWFTGSIDEPFVDAETLTNGEIEHMYQVGYQALQNHAAQTIRGVNIAQDASQKLANNNSNVSAVAASLQNGKIYIGTNNGGVSVIGMDSDTLEDVYNSNITTTDDAGTSWTSPFNYVVSLAVGQSYGNGTLLSIGSFSSGVGGTAGLWAESQDTTLKDFFATNYNPFGSNLLQSNLTIDNSLQVTNSLSTRFDDFATDATSSAALLDLFKVDNMGQLLSRTASTSAFAFQIQDPSGNNLFNIDSRDLGNATLTINQPGGGDILAGSSSGSMKFRFDNAGVLYANEFIDTQNNSYFLDPANSITSLTTAGSVAVASTSALANRSPLQVSVTSNVAGGVDVYNYANTPGFVGYRADGTQGSPTPVQSGDGLAFLGARGFVGPSFTNTSSGVIQISAAENWTSSAQGSYMTFETTPTGSTSRAERMRITSAGNVGIGTTNPIYTLDVRDSATGSDINTGTGLNNDPTIYSNGGSNWFRIGGAIGLAMWGDGNATVNNSPNLFISSGGNVGIKTSTTVAPLTVTADGTGNYAGDTGVGQLIITGSSDTTKRLGLMIDTTNNVAKIQGTHYGTGPYNLALESAGGNVGIGTTNPNNQFQIYGGTLNIDDNWSPDQQLCMNANDIWKCVTTGDANLYLQYAVSGDISIGGGSGTQNLIMQTGSIEPSAVSNSGGSIWKFGNAAWSGNAPASNSTNSVTGIEYVGGSGSQLFTISSAPGQASLQMDGSTFVGDGISYNPLGVSGASDGYLVVQNDASIGGSAEVHSSIWADGNSGNGGGCCDIYFGSYGGTGEGIASKRTAGGNQYGLDFYTGSVANFQIANNGYEYQRNLQNLNGNVYICGQAGETVYNFGGCTGSLRKYKQNIDDFTNALSDIRQLDPITYNWNPDTYTAPPGELNRRQVGIIAEDMQAVDSLFSSYNYDKDGSNQTLGGVDYPKLSVLAIAGIKALDASNSATLAMVQNLQNLELNETGDIAITDATPSANFTIPSYYTINDALGNPISRMGAFVELVVGNLRVGSVQAQQVLTNSLAVATDNVSIAGQSLHDYVVSIVNQVLQTTSGGGTSSPIASIDQLHTNLVSPLASDSAIAIDLQNSKVSVKNTTTGQTVASIDNTGNATFSGTVNSQNLAVNGDATISGTLHVNQIQANSIAGLQEVVGTLSAQTVNNVTNIYFASPSSTTTGENNTPGSGNSGNNYNGVPASQLGELTDSGGYANIASFSAYLSYVPNLNATTGMFSDGLISLGPTSLTDTTISGTLTIGNQLILADNTINVLGQDVQIQPLRQGGIAFAGGQVHIDSDGNLNVYGKAMFNSDLAARIISPLSGEDLNINLPSDNGHDSQFVIHNSTNSAVFSVNQLGDIVASGEATIAKLNLNIAQPAFAISSTEVVATGSAGTAAIGAHQTELTIDNVHVTSNSLIYITPVGQSLETPYLLRQVPGKSFTVGIQSAQLIQTPFNWLIVN